MKLDIVATSEPSAADRELILQLLIDYNDSRTGPTPLVQLALLLRDENGETVGGLTSYLFYDWLYVDVLVIPEAQRGRGLGSELLRRAETAAREQGCLGVWLSTYSFQARGFYEKHGYELFGQIDDYPRGAQRFFMGKQL